MKTMFWKWLRVSIEMIVAMLIMATGVTLWLFMIMPDPICFLIGFGGSILYVFASEDLDTCEKIARKREERKRLLMEKK